MAISIKERIEQGEDPESARLAALKEFGNVTLTRDSMRSVWRPRVFESVEALWHDIRIGMRSLRRAKGLAATVVVTLALGIGANAAIFSVVRAVLLRPLVNRDEDRLIYIRQVAPGSGPRTSRSRCPKSTISSRASPALPPSAIFRRWISRCSALAANRVSSRPAWSADRSLT